MNERSLEERLADGYDLEHVPTRIAVYRETIVPRAAGELVEAYQRLLQHAGYRTRFDTSDCLDGFERLRREPIERIQRMLLFERGWDDLAIADAALRALAESLGSRAFDPSVPWHPGELLYEAVRRYARAPSD